MISSTFITRPRLAMVVSIVISLAGGLALLALPVQQYPQITPPTINVSATYPGASAEVIADVVGGPLETAINGVEDMIYMSSNSSNAGQYSLSVTFAVGTDPDIAQVNVQNRAQLALSQLPTAVAEQGVTVNASSPDFLMALGFYSAEGSLTPLEVTNYVATSVVDSLSRVNGVGEASAVGAAQYSMRIWLDPIQMTALRLTPDDEALWGRISPLLGGDARFRPPRVRDIATGFGIDEREVRRVLKLTQKLGRTDQIAQDHFFARPVTAEMVAILHDVAARTPDGWFTAAAFRDRVQNGRKVAIEILDFFDRHGLTLRRGDLRRINPHRADLFGQPGRESSPVGRPDFNSGWGSETVPGGFDSHSLPPSSQGQP